MKFPHLLSKTRNSNTYKLTTTVLRQRFLVNTLYRHNWCMYSYNAGQKSLGHRKSLTQLPVVSYYYQIIVLSTHSFTPSPLSRGPKSMLSLTCTKIFLPTATLSRGKGGVDYIFTGDMKFDH